MLLIISKWGLAESSLVPVEDNEPEGIITVSAKRDVLMLPFFFSSGRDTIYTVVMNIANE